VARVQSVRWGLVLVRVLRAWRAFITLRLVRTPLLFFVGFDGNVSDSLQGERQLVATLRRSGRQQQQRRVLAAWTGAVRS
jgi:hypothetical protein